MSMLQMKNVGYSYASPRKRVFAGLDLSFAEGGFYAIVGPSGAGKSTLLSLLAGLDEPETGEVSYGGEDIRITGYARHRREHVSLVFQSYNLIDYLTPLENIRLVNKGASDQILLGLGLTPAETRRSILKLSGGQQQRVAIGRALAANAPVILADEPTGNLDEATADGIVDILEEAAHRNNKCVVVVTHSSRIAKRADVVIRLRGGKAAITERRPVRATAVSG
ncbi:ATP-binding cassette domain-containing protein [Pseudactinotalea sp. HY160]|uniref:ABC transporter ATP-binding protein n=1 Tax=Pseudactinotalea sp. HY160 TaxID=2654490 RepID=UPI00128E708B|nr:ABC transporter ATP-binding protein [Pseudactinotalea sp. HY160]MPV49108.1 ATP-binding cassette domain-containing protein [Pseudactinotalea sp. HY160]